MMKATVWLIVGLCLVLWAGCGIAFGQPPSGSDSPLQRWQLKYVTDKPNYLVQEPVRLKVTFRNMTQAPLLFPRDVGKAAVSMTQAPLLFPGDVAFSGSRVFLASEREGFRAWRLDAGPYEHVRDLREVTQKEVLPNAEISIQFWVLLGREGSAATPSFVFAKPGTYRIALDREGSASGKVVVVEAQREEDRLAQKQWDVGCGRLFLGTSRSRAEAEAASLRCEALVKATPRSVYAPYAAVGAARFRWLRSRSEHDLDSARFKSLLDLVINEHKGSPVQEQAMVLLVKGYLHHKDTRHEAKQAAQQLAAEYPESDYLTELRRTYGDNFERMEQPRPAAPLLPKTAAKADLSIHGAEVIPQGPREAFQGYWAAWASEGADLASRLSENFVSDRGPKQEALRAWRKGLERVNLMHLEVRVASAAGVDSYSRPAALPAGSPAKWTGEICIIEGGVLSRFQNRRTGAIETEKLEQMIWAFRHEEGRWMMVSEHIRSRNLTGALLGEQLYASLEKQIVLWRVSDGERKRHPFQEIKDRLDIAGRVVDTRTEWKGTGLTMVGPNREQVQITGNLRLLLRDEQTEPPGKQWIERKITLLLDLAPDEKSLLLKDIQVSE